MKILDAASFVRNSHQLKTVTNSDVNNEISIPRYARFVKDPILLTEKLQLSPDIKI
jgi:hypothetical protein